MLARLAILLSGSGSTYANLAERCVAGTLAAEIVLVISSRADAGGVALAQRCGHPCVVAGRAEEVTAALLAYRADLIAMCGWMRFYDPPAAFAGRVLNIHPSLLPAFGGKGMYGIHVHRAVLASGVKETGCTVHLVTGDYDSGPVLGRRRVPVMAGDSAEILQARVQTAERELYPQAIAELLASRQVPPTT